MLSGRRIYDTSGQQTSSSLESTHSCGPVFILSPLTRLTAIAHSEMIMIKLAGFFLILLLLSTAQNANKTEAGQGKKARSARINCLPEGFGLADVVSYLRSASGKEKHITIKQKLAELKARCKRGRLLDGKGREIRFFRPACFGNPPADYEEIRQRESGELARLQKDYNVIILECDLRIQ